MPCGCRCGAGAGGGAPRSRCFGGAASPAPAALSDSWLAPRVLVGVTVVCPAAKKTVGNLGFGFLLHGGLYRLFISSF